MAIVHPTTGEERGVPGSIARHDLDETGRVRAVGIQFVIARDRADIHLPAGAGLRIEHSRVELDDPSLGKVTAQILDLAGVGMTVSRLLDTIQEPDRLIEETIAGLIEQGAVRLEIPD